MTTWTVEKKETRWGRLYVGQKIKKNHNTSKEDLVVVFSAPAMVILTTEDSKKTYILTVRYSYSSELVTVEEYNFAMRAKGVSDVLSSDYTQWNTVTVKDGELGMVMDFETKETVRAGVELMCISGSTHKVEFIGPDSCVITTSQERTFSWNVGDFLRVFRGISKDE
ncbi:MAG: hypothetical protein ACRC9Y_07345 [Aeromonas veronii]